MSIELHKFLAIHPGYSRLGLADDARGDPVVVPVAPAGRCVRLLSRVPLLKNLVPIKRYRLDNARVTGLFVHALAVQYGAQAAGKALGKLRLALDGAAPLNRPLIDRADKIARRQLAKQVRLQAATAGVSPKTGSPSALAPLSASPSPASIPPGLPPRAALGSQPSQTGSLIPCAAAKPIQASFTGALPGLPNLGNTCYANAAVKFLISAFGIDAVTRGQATSDAPSSGRRSPGAAVAAFMRTLVATSGTMAEAPLQNLFTSLRGTPQLWSFGRSNMLEQHDAGDFLESMVNCLELYDVPSHVTQAFRAAGPGHPSVLNGPASTLTNVRLEDAEEGIDLQTIMQKLITIPKEAPEGARPREYTVQGLAVKRIADLRGFNLRVTFPHEVAVDGPLRLPKTRIDFDTSVILPITDVEYGIQYEVELAPVAVVMHSGTTRSGHYWMYRKTAQGWECHDDRSVSPVKTVPPQGRAVLISFCVVGVR